MARRHWRYPALAGTSTRIHPRTGRPRKRFTQRAVKRTGVPCVSRRPGHLPWAGQLVGYPIIKLEERSRDVHAYLRSLEEAIICSLQRYGIAGVRRKGFTGVWVGERKIAFIGVGIRRWVTMHGFAVNVCPDLSYFRAIVPCGIRECEITSMACETEHASISTAELAEVVCGEFARVFHYDAYAPLCTEALAVLSELNSSSPTESFEQWTK